jgi:hypothetical protein
MLADVKSRPSSVILVTITKEKAVPSQLASPPSRAVATIDSINPATQKINRQFAVTRPADLPTSLARRDEIADLIACAADSTCTAIPSRDTPHT